MVASIGLQILLRLRPYPMRGIGSCDLPALPIPVMQRCRLHLYSSVFTGAISEDAAHATACLQQLAEESTLVPLQLQLVCCACEILLLSVVLPVCAAASEYCPTYDAVCRHLHHAMLSLCTE